MPLSTPVDLQKPVDYASLKDRNALITGGASGLGKSFVHMFAEHGANIVIADLQDDAGKQLVKELEGKEGQYVTSESSPQCYQCKC